MKRILSVILVLSLLACIPLISYAEETTISSPIILMYNNCTSHSTSFTVSASRLGKVIVSFTGNAGCTGAKIVTKIQKKSGTSWVTVSGATWSETIYVRTGTRTYSKQLSSGSYRAVAAYTIYGTNGNPDSFTDTKYAG